MLIYTSHRRAIGEHLRYSLFLLFLILFGLRPESISSIKLITNE